MRTTLLSHYRRQNEEDDKEDDKEEEVATTAYLELSAWKKRRNCSVFPWTLFLQNPKHEISQRNQKYLRSNVLIDMEDDHDESTCGVCVIT